jgi:hypothetical protein
MYKPKTSIVRVGSRSITTSFLHWPNGEEAQLCWQQQQTSRVDGTGRENLRISGVNPPVDAALGEGGDTSVSSRSRRRSGRPWRDGVHSLELGIRLGWPPH